MIDRYIRVTVWGRNLSTIAEMLPNNSSGPALDEVALSLIRWSIASRAVLCELAPDTMQRGDGMLGHPE